MVTLDTKRMQKFSRDLIKAGGITFSSQLDKMLEETQELREAKIKGDPVEIVKEAYDVLQAALTLLCLTTDRDDYFDYYFTETQKLPIFHKTQLVRLESIIKSYREGEMKLDSVEEFVESCHSIVILALFEYWRACSIACSLIANAKGRENEKKYGIGGER